MNKAQAAALFLILGIAALLLYKIRVLGIVPREIAPILGHQIVLSLMVQPREPEVVLETPVPESDDRQEITREAAVSEDYSFTIVPMAGGRLGRWRRSGSLEPCNILYSYFAVVRAKTWDLPADLLVDGDLPDEVGGWLAPYSGHTQAQETIARETRKRLGEPASRSVRVRVERLFDAVRSTVTEVAPGPEVPESPEEVLRRGVGSDHGAHALLVALLREAGVPARLVSGLELSEGRSKSPHVWAEAWAGEWVPLCVSHDLLARLDEAHLLVAHGSPKAAGATGADLDLRYEVQESMRPRKTVTEGIADHPLNTMRMWSSFKRVHVSLNLLAILLSIPVAASVVAAFRTMVGIVPFGTFLPALLAISFRHGGAASGMAALVFVLLVATLFRWAVDRLHLLHTARLTVLMSVLVGVILLVGAAGLRLGRPDIAYAAVFPVVVLTLTAERFFLSLQEQGFWDSARRMGWTLGMSLVCYAAIASHGVQSALLCYPELLVAVTALNLLIGSYDGLRLVEWIRFRRLLFDPCPLVGVPAHVRIPAFGRPRRLRHEPAEPAVHPAQEPAATLSARRRQDPVQGATSGVRAADAAALPGPRHHARVAWPGA